MEILKDARTICVMNFFLYKPDQYQDKIKYTCTQIDPIAYAIILVIILIIFRLFIQVKFIPIEYDIENPWINF